MTEIAQLQQRIRDLELKVSRKKEIIADMSSLLKDTEGQYEELKLENAKLKEETSSRKGGQGSKAVNVGDDEEEDESLSEKVDKFLKSLCANSDRKTIQRAELHALVISILAVLHHIDHNEELSAALVPSDAAQEKAAQIALQYALAFFQQLQQQPSLIKTESFPLQWLLGVFPLSSSASAAGEGAWLPLHIFLAADPPDSDAYLQHLDALLEAFGAAAFREEVSPLSVYVSRPFPQREVVQRLLSFSPSALLQEDEDGCTPFMHACACNEVTEVVEYIAEREPGCLSLSDHFGGGGVHYASFFGSPLVLSLLLSLSPSLALQREGNGALPLHDAVQNLRGTDTQRQLIPLLLAHAPEACWERDDFGALPLHRAAKCSDLGAFEMVWEGFREGVFVPDEEGLLPLHYFAQRGDKDTMLDLIQFILEKNPQCLVYGEREVEKAKMQAKAAVKRGIESRGQRAGKGGEGDKGGKAQRRGSTAGGAGGLGGEIGGRRKSCVNRRGSLHAQYKR